MVTQVFSQFKIWKSSGVLPAKGTILVFSKDSPIL